MYKKEGQVQGNGDKGKEGKTHFIFELLGLGSPGP